MKGALTGRYDSIAGDVRNTLRDAKIATTGVDRSDMSIVSSFDNADARDNAASELRRAMPDMVFTNSGASGGQFTLTGTLTDIAVTQVQTNPLKQKFTTTHHPNKHMGEP